jgi:hypothetical protein
MRHPYKLRRWRMNIDGVERHFYTCARPGRTADHKSKIASVADGLVLDWLKVLPGPQPAIVSLLGSKPDGTSEFSFYTFRGSFESGQKPTFQEWLADRGFLIPVIEVPTTDTKRLDNQLLFEISEAVLRLVGDGRVPIVMDSGGEQRTGSVSRFLKALEASDQS